jgi:hypothetical protein
MFVSADCFGARRMTDEEVTSIQGELESMAHNVRGIGLTDRRRVRAKPKG